MDELGAMATNINLRGAHVFPASPCTPCAVYKAVDEYRASEGIVDPIYSIVEDGDFHFVPLLTDAQVKAHRRSFPRGDQMRFIDAVFWRKGG